MLFQKLFIIILVTSTYLFGNNLVLVDCVIEVDLEDDLLEIRPILFSNPQCLYNAQDNFTCSPGASDPVIPEEDWEGTEGHWGCRNCEFRFNPPRDGSIVLLQIKAYHKGINADISIQTEDEEFRLIGSNEWKIHDIPLSTPVPEAFFNIAPLHISSSRVSIIDLFVLWGKTDVTTTSTTGSPTFSTTPDDLSTTVSSTLPTTPADSSTTGSPTFSTTLEDSSTTASSSFSTTTEKDSSTSTTARMTSNTPTEFTLSSSFSTVIRTSTPITFPDIEISHPSFWSFGNAAFIFTLLIACTLALGLLVGAVIYLRRKCFQKNQFKSATFRQNQPSYYFRQNDNHYINNRFAKKTNYWI